ncbi:hypothetical protein BJX68DRAFT_270243 [Aspergillus pseudodeflectus]|uniref:Uncharacterized protein n=1 Tax=Aspergillus pseudodeflectus TaxID=176178 RepID=A0ABR4JT71_9EURO
MSLVLEAAAIKGAKPDVPPEVIVAYNWEVQIEHRKGKTSVATLQITRETKSDAARKLWKLTMKNLGQKEKALVKLGLLGVRISSNTITALTSSLSSTVDGVPSLVSSLQSLNDINLSTFVDMIHDLDVGHHSTQLTIFEKRPFFLKLGRAAVVLLAIAVQIGLSFVAL